MKIVGIDQIKAAAYLQRKRASSGRVVTEAHEYGPREGDRRTQVEPAAAPFA